MNGHWFFKMINTYFVSTGIGSCNWWKLKVLFTLAKQARRYQKKHHSIIYMRQLALPLFLLCFFNAAGQPLDSAGKKPNLAADSTINLYFTSVGETSGLYNGRVFYWYPLMKGHAFYPSDDWHKGAVLYDGTWYHNLSLMYDIYKDEIVLKHPNSIPIRLFSERIQEFRLDDQNFARLQPDKDNVLRNTFYHFLAEGKVSVFASRQKKIEENIVDNTLERSFITGDQFYALKDGKYYVVNSQKQLLSLLKDKRQSITQHLRKQKLKYKKEKERTIVEIAKFYNQSYK